MINPYISIICCVYNGEKFIKDAIESIINQPFKNIELLIMDDGSKDRTIEIIEQYTKNNIVKLYRQSNQGPGVARNNLFKHASGEWIMFLDADDFYLKNSIDDRFVSVLKQCEKNDVDVIRTPRTKCKYDGQIYNKSTLIKEGIFNNTTEESLNVNFEFFTLIYRKNLIINHEIKFKETLPEFESIFRHQAVLNSRCVLLTNSISFSVKRDNEFSITNNWNLIKTQKLKLRYYSELFIQYKSKDAKLKKWAKTKFLDAAYFLKKNGKLTMNEINELSEFKKINLFLIFKNRLLKK